MGQPETVTTIDNPVYDPDGDESGLAGVGVDGINKDPVTSGYTTQCQQKLILKEKPFDKKNLPHQVKFVRRKRVTRQCVMIVLILNLVLLGLAVGIYFTAVRKPNSQSTKDYDTQAVEGKFRIMNREFVSALTDHTTPEFQSMSHDLIHLLSTVYSPGGSTILVSSVNIIGFRKGSISVFFKLLLGDTYNATYAEKQTETLFFAHVKMIEDNMIEFGDYVIDKKTLYFKALPLVHTNGGKTDVYFKSTAPELVPSTTSTSHQHSLMTSYPTVTMKNEMPAQCQSINIDLCQSSEQVPYNQTIFPNWLGHERQEAAESALWQVRRYIQRQCHPYIRRFFCALFVSKCVHSEAGDMPLPPCQRLCKEVLLKCTSSLFGKINIVKCDDLPDSDDPNVCVSSPAVEAYPLRLVGGLGPKEGHVEVYYNHSWGKVCDTHWDDRDANVVCRQLNIGGTAKANKNSYFGVSFVQTHLRNVHCVGNEPHLALCSMDIGSDSWCDEEHAAGVICDYDNRNVTLSVRLYGTRTQSAGRLEVHYNDTWGTVCDDGFGGTEATVACRMLGYRYSGQVKSQSEIPELVPSNGPIWLKSLQCTGRETSLTQCNHRGWGIDMCEHDEDVYIECEELPGSSTGPPSPGIEVRLVGGDSYSGRIEVKHNNVWGTICRHLFTDKTAAVFCRMLDLSTNHATYEMSRYGRGTGQIWLDGIYCNGSEQTILECNHEGWGNTPDCDHLNDVSISCKPTIPGSVSDVVESDAIFKIFKDESVGNISPDKVSRTDNPTQMLVRLVGGDDDPSYGRVELYMDGSWGTVCSHEFHNSSATVICRMLGYNGTGHYLKDVVMEGARNQPILMDYVDCVGSEQSVFDCTFWPKEEITCTHEEDTVIKCLPLSDDVYPVTLFKGEHESEGYVKILHNGVWGTICKHGFGLEEANVTCNMMGYHGDVKVLYQKEMDEPHPTSLMAVNCTGSEQSLFDCTYVDWLDVKECDDWDDHVYIVCDADPVTPLRLVQADNMAPNQGRVEVNIGGQWGTICRFDTEKQTLLVLCRGLGYKDVTTDTVKLIDTEFPGKDPIWLSKVSCNGTETDIRHCEHEGREKSAFICDHDEDLVIQCG